MNKFKPVLSAGLILVSQIAFAQKLPKKCINELLAIPKESLNELPATVIKIKAQAKTGEMPVIGFFFGPGSDDKVTDIGLTVGCAKVLPESPEDMLAVLKDVGLEILDQQLFSKVPNGKPSRKKNVAKPEENQFFGATGDNMAARNRFISGRFTDPRDGKIYKIATIGSQTWMAENLNYAIEGSRCYGDNSGGDSQNKCSTYGRLYNWVTAMTLGSSCNSSFCSDQIQSPNHQGVCPNGWHIPSDAEWNKLFRYIDDTGGRLIRYGVYLKSKTGWYNCGPSGSGSFYLCEDTYGFSALPGGHSSADGSFGGSGDYGGWWSATESSTNYAYYRNMRYLSEYAHWISLVKSDLRSIRCVQN
jgi:uncharacterized protein (TIGR02145 family)